MGSDGQFANSAEKAKVSSEPASLEADKSPEFPKNTVSSLEYNEQQATEVIM